MNSPSVRSKNLTVLLCLATSSFSSCAFRCATSILASEPVSPSPRWTLFHAFHQLHSSDFFFFLIVLCVRVLLRSSRLRNTTRLHLQHCPCHHHWLPPLALFRSGLLSVPVLRGLRLLVHACGDACLVLACSLRLAPSFPLPLLLVLTCTHARSDPACSNFVHLDLFMCL